LGALLTAGALVLLGWLWDGRPLLDALPSGIALAMAILPEEIPVILTVFCRWVQWRISRQKVLTRRVSAVEALGAITVLTVDKTGTLTQNRMLASELAIEGNSFKAEGATVSSHVAALPDAFHNLVEFVMLATPANPFDPMEKAIQNFGRARLSGTMRLHDGHPVEFEYPLSSDILAMTRIYSGEQPSPLTAYLLATKDAQEAVANLCHLTDERRAAVRLQVEDCAQRGLRVLGVAQGYWKAPHTGDHPATARAIARQVGLSERPTVLTEAEIETLEDAALIERLRRTDLCARTEGGRRGHCDGGARHWPTLLLPVHIVLLE
jgi:Ca2+-transporting ATPase